MLASSGNNSGRRWKREAQSRPNELAGPAVAAAAASAAAVVNGPRGPGGSDSKSGTKQARSQTLEATAVPTIHYVSERSLSTVALACVRVCVVCLALALSRGA